MCGIVGFSSAEPQPQAEGLVCQMAETIAHRGPDSAGLFCNSSGKMLLGFRRLAVRDLGIRADQPMKSASGRSAVAFNGELYNTEHLAAKYCPGVKFRTTGDTEVFLESFEQRGYGVLADCNGMFAAAFYDGSNETLTLVRDRMGKKPLYVYEGDGFLAFASELRALRTFGLEPDPDSVPYYFQFGFFPSPMTFYKRTTQVRPGEAVVVRNGRIVSRQRFHEHAAQPWGDQASVDLDALDRTLADAVSIRTLSDVPVGAFLSGGVDSALVAAQLQAAGHRGVPTYTVAFEAHGYNEAPAARQVARHFGLPHVEIPIDDRRLAELVDDYLDCYEQPYADASGIPSMLLCREVKRHVTVALCGDGGDEFFGGYTRYDWYRQALRAQKLPSLARAFLASWTPRLDRRRGARIARLLASHDDAGLYAALTRSWVPGSAAGLLPAVRDVDAAPVHLIRDVFARVDADPLSKAACADATYYIPDDLQVKMDRASMRVALEVRCPLLDYRVARAGARLATPRKFQQGKKSVLKQLLARHLPRKLYERPKHGFSVPMAQWLRGPLRQRVRETLNQRCVRECGWLDVRRAEAVWEDFHRGRPQLAGPVWMLYVLAHSLLQSEAAQHDKQCFSHHAHACSRTEHLKQSAAGRATTLPLETLSGAGRRVA